MLTLLLGGARSGKSALAFRMASAGTSPVTFLATAEASTTRWRRESRSTVPNGPSLGHGRRTCRARKASTLRRPRRTVVIDCLTLWVANLLGAGRDRRGSARRAPGCGGSGRRPARQAVVVSNEVGSGIVPGDPCPGATATCSAE